MTNTLDFEYNILPGRVLFGANRIDNIQAETKMLGTRALIIATPGRTEFAHAVADRLGSLCVGINTQATQHVPYPTIRAAVADVERCTADVLLAVGGGSTIGLAKGVALETRLPILAVPTTYSGSEMTHIWGISRDGRKTTGRDPIVKPRTVIYDPQLTLSLPTQISLTSGINAMAHAVEALYAQNANPVTSLLAEDAIRQLAQSLPIVVKNPHDLQARSRALYGAWLAASVLDSVGMALHHKLCHTLGGSFNLPHAATHTVILPYALHYNLPAAPQARQAISRALQCAAEDVAAAIQDISRNSGGPVALKALGFERADIDKAAEHAVQNPYYNPRPFDRNAIRELLRQAYTGARPVSG